MESMKDEGVDTRPVFYCAHTMPMYDRGENFPVAQDIASRGLSLPSYPQLTEEEVIRVVHSLRKALEHQGYS
jgi:perosamine synthetase